jgi:hypothetical protein
VVLLVGVQLVAALAEVGVAAVFGVRGQPAVEKRLLLLGRARLVEGFDEVQNWSGLWRVKMHVLDGSGARFQASVTTAA